MPSSELCLEAHLDGMGKIQALGRGFAPGKGREPVQVVARDIELAAGRFQRAQLAELLLCAYRKSKKSPPCIIVIARVQSYFTGVD